MLTIERMEIDDVGGNPAKLAAAIVRQLPDLNIAVPVREIASALDIYEIREESLTGIEGALIVPENKSEGAILVNSERPETRKRYTIAHELGHYVNPWHKPPSTEGFRCRARDMVVEHFHPNDRAAKMEAEANLFAAELLMPPPSVDEFMRGKLGADLDHILKMSERFYVSREAAARRYIARVDELAAIIFSKDGIIRYAKLHDKFPRLSVWNKQSLPEGCLSLGSTADIGEVTDWSEISGHTWLERSSGFTVCEQTLAQQNGFRMTLLTVEEEEDEGDHWAPPRFRR